MCLIEEKIFLASGMVYDTRIDLQCLQHNIVLDVVRRAECLHIFTLFGLKHFLPKQISGRHADNVGKAFDSPIGVREAINGEIVLEMRRHDTASGTLIAGLCHLTS